MFVLVIPMVCGLAFEQLKLEIPEEFKTIEVQIKNTDGTCQISYERFAALPARFFLVQFRFFAAIVQESFLITNPGFCEDTLGEEDSVRCPVFDELYEMLDIAKEMVSTMACMFGNMKSLE